MEFYDGEAISLKGKNNDSARPIRTSTESQCSHFWYGSVLDPCSHLVKFMIRHAFYGLTLTSLAGFPSPAGADQTDVVVSASRSAQTSFDAPGSVQTIGRDVIEASGPQVNISEALAGVPGLNAANRNNFSQDLQLSIRGFGSRAPFGVRGVRLLIDGLPQTLPDGQGQSSQFALTSAERIEVLKGPISILYGNAAGGVVQVFSRSPSDKPELTLSAMAGSDGLNRGSLQFSERKGPYGLMVDVASLSSDGFRQYSAAERLHLNSKLEVAHDGGKTSFILNVLKNESEEPGSLLKSEFDSNPHQAVAANVANRYGKTFTQSMAGLVTERKISATQTIGGRLYFGERALDNPLAAANSATGFSMIDRQFYGAGVSSNTQTRVGAIPVRVAAGIDADWVDDNRTARRNTTGTATGPLGRNEENTAENLDIYVQSDWRLTPQFSGLLGARSTQVSLGVKDNFLSDGNGSGSKSYSGFSPVIGLTHHASDTLNLFIQAGSGFETPTLNEVLYTPNGTRTPLNQFTGSLSAAKSDQLEIGIKWRPQKMARLDASLFRARTRDDIAPLFLSPSSSTWQNIDSLRQGFEINGTTQVHPQWTLRGAASWMSAKVDKDFAVIQSGALAPVASGNTMPGVPEHRGFLELAWRSKHWGSQPNRLGTEAAIELHAIGPMMANSTNTARVDGAELAHLRVTHQFRVGAAQIKLFGRLENLTDERYVGSVVADQAFLRFYEPGAPRNWLVGATITLAL